MYKINNTEVFKQQYDLARFIPFNSEAGYDFLNSEFRRRLPELPVFGKTVVTQSHLQRLDLLAHTIYGHTSFWWIFLDYNKIDSVDELTIGSILEYPSPGNLSKLVSELSYSTIANSTDIPAQEQPVPPPIGIDIVISKPVSGRLTFSSEGLPKQSVILKPNRVIDSIRYVASEPWILIDRVIDRTIDEGGYFSVSCLQNNLGAGDIELGSRTETRTGTITFSILNGDSKSITVSQDGDVLVDTGVLGFDGQHLGTLDNSIFYR